MQMNLQLPPEFSETLNKQIQEVYTEAIQTARRDVSITKEYLNINEVCKMFQISRNTLSSWFELGLEKFKIGNKQYVRKSDIDKFVNKFRV